MRTAVVHDWLTGMRGGELVLEAMLPLLPDPTIFTLFHVPGSVSPEIERRPIRTSFLDRLPFARAHYRDFLPLFPRAVESFDLSGFDLVVSSSHCVAKGAVAPPGVAHLCYCHTPVRYAYEQFDAYFPKERTRLYGVKRASSRGCARGTSAPRTGRRATSRTRRPWPSGSGATTAARRPSATRRWTSLLHAGGNGRRAGRLPPRRRRARAVQAVRPRDRRRADARAPPRDRRQRAGAASGSRTAPGPTRPSNSPPTSRASGCATCTGPAPSSCSRARRTSASPPPRPSLAARRSWRSAAAACATSCATASKASSSTIRARRASRPPSRGRSA